jgi:hypothetical protein
MTLRPETSDIEPWIGFPIDQKPRPVVLLDEPVQLGPGFIDVDSKRAWLAGAVEATVPMPAGVLDLVTHRSVDRTSSRVLTISAVEVVEAEFFCDRGPRLLPAYRLSVTGLIDRCVVLDPAVDCWWPPRGQSRRHGTGGGQATVEDDDTTIHFPAFGGVLTDFLHAEFVEYDTCVVGQAATTERAAPPGTAIPAVGVGAHVTGHLAAPLAGRVLLNSTGDPIAVQRASKGPNPGDDAA